MYKILLGAAISASLIASNVEAQVSFQKPEFRTPIRATAVVTKDLRGKQSLSVSRPRSTAVFLMNIPLTAKQKQILNTFKPKSLSFSSANSNLPSKVELGMNDVPVLDQGMHGTCVTFATSGAINALLGKGNYVSPLCSLELGKYLESRSYYPSGWEGSFGPLVLQRFTEFGVISLENQGAKSCAGLIEYPSYEMENTGTAMSLDDYKQLSEDVSDITWYPIITVYQRFSDESPNMESILNKVKATLASKNAKENLRLTFGALLPINHCSAGACAKYHKTDDSWVINNAIRNDENLDFGGHEMIITGYDDDAIALDNENVEHKGLLILRNSWSDQHGDNGDYYMSYDFFKQFVMEVQVVTK